MTLTLLVCLAFFVGVYIYGYFFVAGSAYSGKSSRYSDGVFSVNEVPLREKSSSDFFKWTFGNDIRVPWTEAYSHETAALDTSPISKARVTFINHATTLIETPSLTILTDPHFSERASPLSFLGPKRYHDPYIFHLLPSRRLM